MSISQVASTARLSDAWVRWVDTRTIRNAAIPYFEKLDTEGQVAKWCDGRGLIPLVVDFLFSKVTSAIALFYPVKTVRGLILQTTDLREKCMANNTTLHSICMRFSTSIPPPIYHSQ